MAIIFTTIYKIFALFTHRKERLMLIEKIETLRDINIGEGINISKMLSSDNDSKGKFIAFRLGCFILGLGLGLALSSYLIFDDIKMYNGDIDYHARNLFSVIQGSCVLIGGGLGLIVGFIIENILNKKC